MFYILNLDYRLIVRNIKGLRHRVEKIYGLQNQSLWQKLSVSPCIWPAMLAVRLTGLQAIALPHYRTIVLSHYRWKLIYFSLYTFL